MSAPHQLVSLRSYFYLGLYEQLVTEAKSLGTLSGAVETARLAYLYRGHVSMGNHAVVARDISKDSPTVLQVIKLHSTFLTAKGDTKEMIVEKLNEMVEDGSLAQDKVFPLVAAELYLSSGRTKEALKIVHGGSTLEMMAMAIQILLSINRVDLAQEQLRKMISIEEDDTLTQLAGAWISVVQGDSKVTDALDTYTDLQEKFGSSIMLLNSIAVCQIQKAEYVEALSTLGAARDLALKSKVKISPDTYLNTMICLTHMKKSPEAIQRILTDFRKTSPESAWILKQGELKRSIEKSQKTYS